MLTTDKNEIIESIRMDLEGASDSALARLAETFGVPLQDYSEPVVKISPHTSNHALKKNYREFESERHREQTVYVRVPVVIEGRRYEGRTVVIKGILVPNNEYSGKAVTVLNMGKNRKNRLSLLINNKTSKKIKRNSKIEEFPLAEAQNTQKN